MQPRYCCYFNQTKAEEKSEVFDKADQYGGGEAGLKFALRAHAAQLISANIIQGYLAYADGLVVGWCNTNRKDHYRRMLDPVILEQSSPNTKSVVCFEIAPSYRHKGIASLLLARVVADAKKEGFAAVEGYAYLRERPETFDFSGPLRLYEKAGFSEIGRKNDLIIMQKKL
ncbi:MAG: GNAT family N-acetyltransferase [Clostridiales bacterium]|nr:GNAT family N-acetyltransferase [Clostridiales bacterium]